MLLTGGGTGGHITPLLAVADEIKKQSKQTVVVYVGERHGKFSHLTDGHTAIDEIFTVSSGKFRRYHRQSWLKRLLDIKTNLQNLRDVFLVVLGVFQAWWLLGRVKPDVVFLKGGYVGVPVGLAAVMHGIPFLTHDSDALPGLANKLVSRWANLHATALPVHKYPYPLAKTKQVGVIVSKDYKVVGPSQQASFKQHLNLPQDAPMLLVTGGSLGAARLNKAFAEAAEQLLEGFNKLQIVHQVGKGNLKVYGDYQHERLHVLEFLSPMHVYTGAADVVVTRAGANTLAELGTQGKACVVVPNPDLTGGHQLKNAELLEASGSVVVVRENEVNHQLVSVVTHLLKDPRKRTELGKQARKNTVQNAARTLASLLLNAQIRQ